MKQHHRLAIQVAIQSACEYVSTDTLTGMPDDALITCASQFAGMTPADIDELLAQADAVELRFTRLAAKSAPERSTLVQGLEVLENLRMHADSRMKHLLWLKPHDEILFYSAEHMKISIKYTVLVKQSRTRDVYKQGVRAFWLDENNQVRMEEFTPELLNPAVDKTGNPTNNQTFIKSGAALWRDLIANHLDQRWQELNNGTQSGTRREQRPARSDRPSNTRS